MPGTGCRDCGGAVSVVASRRKPLEQGRTFMRPGRLFSVILLGAWAAAGVSLPAAQASKPRPAAPAKPAPTPSTVTGWVDSVTWVAGPALDVVGWAVDVRMGSPVAKVEVLLNEKVAGIARVAEVRRDVAQTYRRNDYLKSGWKARVELKGLPAETYRVKVRAWNVRGESALLNTVRPIDIRVR